MHTGGPTFSRNRIDASRGRLTDGVSSLRGSGDTERPVSKNLDRALSLLGGDKEIDGHALQELGGHFTEIGRQHPAVSTLAANLETLFTETASSDLLFLQDSLHQGICKIPMDTNPALLRPSYDSSLRNSLNIREVSDATGAAAASAGSTVVDATSIASRMATLGVDSYAAFPDLMTAIPPNRLDLQTLFLDKIESMAAARRDTALTAILTKKGAAQNVAALERDLAKSTAAPPVPHGERLSEVRGLWAPMKKIQSAMMLIDEGYHMEFGAKTPAAEAAAGAGGAGAGAAKIIYLDIDIKATAPDGSQELWMEVKKYKSFSADSTTFSEISTQLQRLMASADKVATDTGSPKATVHLHLAKEAAPEVVAAFERILGKGNGMVAFERPSS